MSFQSPAPCFTSRSRPGHHSRQPTTHDTLQNNNLSNSPSHAIKFKTSTLRLPGGISVNLFSLISKFEALDSLSLPTNVPTLQPAALQLSRGSHRLRGGTYASPQKRLSIIFSPRNHSGNRYRSIYSEDDFGSAGEDILGEANLITHGYAGENSGPGRIRRHKLPRTPASIRLPGRNRKASPIAAPTTYPQIPPTRGNRGSAVRDIIRFYDGSTDLFVDSGALHIPSSAHIASFTAVSNGVKTQAKPSVAPQVPLTPLSRRFNNDTEPPSMRSTVNSKQTITSTKSKTPVTPTKLSHISIPKRRNLFSAQTKSNPLCFQDSPTKSTTTNTSPLTSLTAWTQPDGPADRGRPFLHKDTALKHSKALSSTKPDTSQYCENGRRGTLQWPRTKTKPLSVTQRNVSDKIEAFYRARSLERKLENARDFNVGPPLVPLVEQRKDEAEQNAAKNIRNMECNERRMSKVAKLKMLFESDLAPQSSNQESPSSEAKCQRNTVVAGKELKKTHPASLSSPPPPPQLPRLKRGGSIVSRELYLEAIPPVPQPIYVRAGQDDISRPSQTSGRSPRTKSKIIGEKVNMFERTGYSDRVIEPRLTHGTLTKEIGKSTTGMYKNLFEKPLMGQNEVYDVTKGKWFVSESDVKEIVDEFQDTEMIGKTGKRRTVIGRWNTIVPQPLTIAPKSFPAVTAGGIDGAGADHRQEMVVKEAQCGLKEPKPLRIVEMKRLMLLCREKAPRGKMPKAACSRKL